jgi:hypothetical protein
VKRKWGGKRAGAGRYYNLWSRIYLAQRYAHLGRFSRPTRSPVASSPPDKILISIA